jgi:hypothetical protein
MKPPPESVLGSALLGLAAACGGASSAERGTPFAFHDATASAGLAFTLTAGGDPPRAIVEVKGGGLALVDYDADGDEDVFVPNGATLESQGRGPGARLFAQAEELVFRDATAEAGITFAGWGMGVAVGDVHGDGHDDLFLAAFGPDTLLANERGRFRDAGVQAGLDDPGFGTGCAFGDLDQDGDLDLYLVRYVEFDPAAPPPPARFLGVEVFAGPAGLTPLADRVYQNDGAGRFADVTAESGCADVPPSYGLGCLILDLDADGFQDVFVGNDSMANFLFAGRGGMRFEELALRAGVAVNADGESQATMGIASGDVNGDGRADIFTTNFMNDTNTLWVSRKSGLDFEDKTQVFGLAHVSRPFLGWATGFFDFDQDADLDLLAFNGHVYPEAAVRALGSTARQVPLLFERAGERFQRVLPDGPTAWLAEAHNDRSAVFGDLDHDQDVDVIVAERNGPLRLLRNDGAVGPGLVVRVADRRAGSRNRRGLGARLELEAADGTRAARWIASGCSYLSASAPEAAFGLGAMPGPFALEVRWPDGELQRLEGVSAGRLEVVRE